jgi:hypothetical protein
MIEAVRTGLLIVNILVEQVFASQQADTAQQQ